MMIPRIDSSNIGLLLIDVQPTFLDYAFPDQSEGLESLLVRYEHLLMLADWMSDSASATTPIRSLTQTGVIQTRSLAQL